MERLIFTRCTVSDGSIELESGPSDVFEVPINPAEFKRSLGITYNDEVTGKNDPIGKSGLPLKFKTTKSEKLDFNITLDGTGVVPNAVDSDVSEQIDALRDIIYTYSGDIHEPNVVHIAWGLDLEFYGRLTSLNIDYTLFDPDGTPLRAKLTMSFTEFITAMLEALKAKRRSPDLTHEVRVRAGDTLPLLCERIYKDPSQHILVAAFNDLDGFRALVPNTVLRFPPIRGKA